MSQQAESIDRLLDGVRVMPVVTIEDAEHAVPLADALLEGGIRAIEVTLRTEAALAAVERIARTRPDMTVGTGTILTPDDLGRSEDAGAAFAVSPGLTPLLAKAASVCLDRLPLLPGTATASEVLIAMEYGFTRLKFFPAEAAGGRPMLKSIGAPIPQVRFCPTGGVTPETLADYLALPNVFCVGGSWLTPAAAMAEGRWDEITRLAKAAAAH
jgi:2-dehydro-3-deoxyphosphogluconate aldolase/(4S)-4-hydroxy-2-oxoglutarate aldolase